MDSQARPHRGHHRGLTIKIVEADLREFSGRLRVYVDWEAVDEGD